MQFHIINVSGGTFKNDDGEKVSYGSVNVLDAEVTKMDGFAGLTVKKMKCDPDLIHKIGDYVPANFNLTIETNGTTIHEPV